MVLVTHGAYRFSDILQFPLWIEQAVPLFILIQVFHSYKKEIVCYPKLSKIWHRIFKPFLIIQLAFLAYMYGDYVLNGVDLGEKLVNTIACGGNGPGSYYIWVYIQMALLCPLLYRWVRYKYSFAIFVGICISGEVFCSLVEMPEYIYRLLCLRYIFLIYLGYLWVKNGGILLNRKTILLSMISGGAIVVLNVTHSGYPEMNFEPWVFDTVWTSYHWFTYYLPWSLLAFLICKCYLWKPTWRVNKLILLCGKRSYEIFLWQMLVFGIFPLPDYIDIFVSLLPLLLYERKMIVDSILSK